MKIKILRPKRNRVSPSRETARKGFTLIELMISSFIILVVVLAALAVYNKSNRTTVDQQQYTELQSDVRSAMYLVSRDVRSAGVGLYPTIAGYFMEGMDAYGPGLVSSDAIRVMGNFDDPLSLRIKDYSGGVGGGAATAELYDIADLLTSYACPEYFEDKTFLVISTRCPGCFAFRYVANDQFHACSAQAQDHVNFTPGSSELNPPGGLVDSTCTADCWPDSIVTVGQIKLIWLDTTGVAGDYPEMNLTVGQKGYLGVPNTLYVTTTSPESQTMGMFHFPLAFNIENLQFQYNGDFDGDGTLDGFTDWDNANWTIDPNDDEITKTAKTERIQRIHQVRMWILGKTLKASVNVSHSASTNVSIYRRPAIANSPGALQDDYHRRFLLDSTANVRNLSLNLYNTGER